MSLIRLLTSALEAYIAFSRWRQRTYLYDLEDEIDTLAADGSPSAKLRLERVAKRLKAERKRVA